MERLIARAVGLAPPRTVRAVGRWFMSGRRRRRVYDLVNRATKEGWEGRVQSGPLAGMRLEGGDTAGYLLGVSEPLLQKVIARQLPKGGVFYDIGANVGYVSLLACQAGARVHCFEPVSDTAATLRRNLASNGFASAEVHEVALSDATGTAEFTVTDDPGRAGLAEFRTEGERLRVQTARLDDLDLEPPDVVKIDVEGAEVLALEGMRKTLRQHRPVVVVEIHGDTMAASRGVLEECGLAVDIVDRDGMPHLVASA
jgi:FkbM family methyltransferase